jgi:hypothetical protein
MSLFFIYFYTQCISVCKKPILVCKRINMLSIRISFKLNIFDFRQLLSNQTVCNCQKVKVHIGVQECKKLQSKGNITIYMYLQHRSVYFQTRPYPGGLWGLTPLLPKCFSDSWKRNKNEYKQIFDAFFKVYFLTPKKKSFFKPPFRKKILYMTLFPDEH